MKTVEARIHSDDFVYDEKFDATSYFMKASDADLIALIEIGFRGDYPADYVATHLEQIPTNVQNILDYVARKDSMGFEVIVNDEQASVWIKENRPQLVKYLST